jgi:hypothetical protein
VSIVNNPGFWGYNLTLDVPAGLTLTGLTKGDFDGNFIANVPGKVAFLNDNIAEGTQPADFTGDGVLFYATFKIDNAAVVGTEYEIGVGLTGGNATNFVNAAEEAIVFTAESGKVTASKLQPTKDDLTFELPVTVTYSGSPQAVSVSKSNIQIGDFTLYYTGAGGTTYAKSATAPTNAGKYTVTAQVAENSSYAAATLALGTLTITPQTLTIVWPTVDETITPGAALSTVTLSGGSTQYGTFAWSDPTQIVSGTNANYMVTFTPSEQYANANYSYPTNGSVTVNVGAKGTPTADDLNAAYPDLTYSGSAKAVTVTAKGTGMGAITVYYESKNDTSYSKSTTAPTNAGTYKVTVNIAEGDLFAAVTDLALNDLVIAKQSVSIPWPSLTATYETGTTLSQIALGGCAYGAFAWTADGTTAITESGNYQVEFTPNAGHPDTNYDYGAKTDGKYLHNVYVTVEGDRLKGDGDGDGTITLADINLLAKLAAKITTAELTQEDKDALDMNGDGAFTTVDLLLLAKKFVGLE